MKVMIGAVGSSGDLNPMLMLGAELRRRGHECTILAGAWQASAARKLGLDFHPILPTEQFAVFSKNSAGTDSSGGDWATFLYDAVLPAVAPTVDYVCRHAEPGRTLLVGATHVIGLRLASERLGLPLLTTNVQPEPPRSLDPDEASSRYFNGLFTRQLNRLRREAGLGDACAPFLQWLFSGRRIVSLFPSWFPQPGIDAPLDASNHALNFLFDDPDVHARTPVALDAFLATRDQPIIFTLGTGNCFVREFFAAAVEAAQAIRRPAILLTREREQLPRTLPRDVLHLDYLAFDRHLPEAGAIVHHGGIGTCAQALRAGVPQLIVPGRYDQHDNAARNVAFGVGATLQAAELDGGRLASLLERLLDDRDVEAACVRYRERFDPGHTTAWCCDVIEREFLSEDMHVEP